MRRAGGDGRRGALVGADGSEATGAIRAALVVQLALGLIGGVGIVKDLVHAHHVPEAARGTPKKAVAAKAPMRPPVVDRARSLMVSL